jgi:hypothetical protein
LNGLFYRHPAYGKCLRKVSWRWGLDSGSCLRSPKFSKTEASSKGETAQTKKYLRTRKTQGIFMRKLGIAHLHSQNLIFFFVGPFIPEC